MYPIICFSLTRVSPCALAGQPQRSAAARSRLLGYRASHPPLLTDGRSVRRQPLEERLKVHNTLFRPAFADASAVLLV